MALFSFLLFLFFVLSIRANEVYNAGIVSDSFIPDIFNDDPHCDNHMHQFYRKMECYPENKRGTKCPTSYKCPTLQNRSSDMCYYGSRSYPVGFNLTRKHVDFHTPCIQSCQCVRMYEGARFYCSREPGKSCNTPSGCRHFRFLEDFPCCQRGITSCPHGKPDSVKCEFEGRTYKEGERFFPGDDMTCTQCICAAGFNGTIAAPFCQQFSCVLELWGDTPVMLTRGCIPVYLSDTGCCPLGYRCPKPSDRVIKSGKKSFNKTDKKCQFGNLTMNVGDQLSSWTVSGEGAKKTVCTCRVPPIASCVRKNFIVDEEFRREFARKELDGCHKSGSKNVPEKLLVAGLNVDPECNNHIHKFYREMGCRPEMTPGVKCPTSYDCPSLKDRKPDMCYYKNQSYPIGFNLTKTMVELGNPCRQSCQCGRVDDGARFFCSGEPKKTCPTSPGCRHFHFSLDVPCCQMGVTSCPSGAAESVKCEFEGRSYKEGERFFPGDDVTCTQCICAAGFNGTIAKPFCHNFSDVVEFLGEGPVNVELFKETPSKIAKGCIPIYLGENGCFPLVYRCPEPSDQVVKAEKKLNSPKKTEKKCRFGQLTMEVGDQLSPWTSKEGGGKSVECTCRVPPLPLCVRRNAMTEDLRRAYAVEDLGQ